MHDAATHSEKEDKNSSGYLCVTADNRTPDTPTTTAAMRTDRTSVLEVRRRSPRACRSCTNETAAAKVILATLVSTARKTTHAIPVISTTLAAEPLETTPDAS